MGEDRVKEYRIKVRESNGWYVTRGRTIWAHDKDEAAEAYADSLAQQNCPGEVKFAVESCSAKVFMMFTYKPIPQPTYELIKD